MKLIISKTWLIITKALLMKNSNNKLNTRLNSSKYNINLDKYPTNPKNDGYQKQIINDLKNVISLIYNL